MAGVLRILVEVDERVEQGIQAARPGEVGGLHPAGVGLAGPGGGGEGEQGADAKRGGRGGGDQLPPLKAGLEPGLRRRLRRPLVELPSTATKRRAWFRACDSQQRRAWRSSGPRAAS